MGYFLRLAADNLKRDARFSIILAVMFFAVGVAAQMAAIKLVGGFFYSREIYGQIDLKNNHDVNFLTASESNPFRKFSVPADSGAGGGKISNFWFAAVNAFLLIYIFFVLILALRSVVFSNFYQNNSTRIRPPTFYENKFSFLIMKLIKIYVDKFQKKKIVKTGFYIN